MKRLLLLSTLAAALVPAVVLAAPARTAKAPAAPALAGCPVFPASNPWNQRVDRLPVAKNSGTMIGSIGSDNLHADFGSGEWDGGPIGIPFTVVDGSQAKVRVSFDYDEDSDRVPYPVPANAPIEGGRDADGDRHVIVVDRSACRLYELWDAHPQDGGASWHAGSGATWNLRSNRLRRAGFTSADAAGLPILPGLVRFDEVAAGSINHAIRFTADRTRTSFIWPARHQAGESGSSSLPPMGLRVRLKKGVSLRGLPKQAKVIATAMKRYGMLLADNGSSWYYSGAPDERWDNDQLHALDRLKGSDFEVVDAARLRKRAR